LNTLPPEAARAANSALEAAELDRSFGCVDLLESDGRWLVIEVGTDGLTYPVTFARH